MSSKKYIYIISSILATSITLSGCSSTMNKEAGTPPPNTSVPAYSGEEAILSFGDIYAASVAKAQAEGFVEAMTTPASKIEYIYDPSIDKVLGAEGSDSIYYAADYKTFPLSTIMDFLSTVNETIKADSNTKGQYTFIAKNPQTSEDTKFIFQTSNGLITQYTIELLTDNGILTSITIKYGNISEKEKANIKQGIKNSEQDALIPTYNIDNVPVEEELPPAQ